MIYLIGLPLITGLASVLQNTINAFSTKAANRRQEELVRAQQRYYSPAEYRKRLDLGGFNPRLAGNYQEPSVGVANVQSFQSDLSGLAKAVEQHYKAQESDADTYGKRLDNRKSEIDLGIDTDEVTEIDSSGKPLYTHEPQSPYEKSLQNRNLIEKGQIAGDALKYKVQKMEAMYTIDNAENRIALEKQKISTLKKINEIQEYDVKEAEYMKKMLVVYGIFDNDPNEIKLLKMASVKIDGKKLEDNPIAWNYLKMIIKNIRE